LISSGQRAIERGPPIETLVCELLAAASHYCPAPKRHQSTAERRTTDDGDWKCESWSRKTFVTLDGVMEAPDKWQPPNELFDAD
jgi:hypothetical protein